MEKITIPTEPIGSIPRPKELIIAQRNYRYGTMTYDRLSDYYTRAIQTTIQQFETTGSSIITDGEQTNPSFLTYPILHNIFFCLSVHH
ncbi:unnamed protein product [Adineta steineri]|uniref:Methionine synthase n=1 Tax=Adineta steineri TaxID=433720 RepID=A0A820S6J1_9BILA|nr:unnamed protein product [Adineta steineri]